MNYILILTIVLLALTYFSSFKGLTPTCDRFVLNTYFYLLTSFMIMLSIYEYIKEKDEFIEKVNKNIIPVLVAYICLFIGILFIPKEYVLIKHALWLTFIFISSILLTRIKDDEDLKQTALLTATIFAVVSLIAYYFKDALASHNISWTSLGLFIAFSLLSIFIKNDKSDLSKLLGILIIGFVCYFILVETKELFLKQDECIFPDYVNESAGFFIYIKNIFYRLNDLS
jgi:FtsH-binding integral membrane protein